MPAIIDGDDIEKYPPADECPPWEVSTEVNPKTGISLPADCQAIAWIDEKGNLREAIVEER